MPDDEFELAATLAAVAQVLATERTLAAVVQRACVLAAETIDACDHADVMVPAAGGTMGVPAATDWVGIRIVSIEEECGEGPCLDAFRLGTVVTVDDLAAETRWPRFTRRCISDTPVRSGVGLPLLVGERAIGAFDLYADRPHAFSEQDRTMAALFAAHAAVAVAAVNDRGHLERALTSRDMLGQAKGILMSESGMSAEEAFDRLKSASQRLNRKLTEVARDVVRGASRAPEGACSDERRPRPGA